MRTTCGQNFSSVFTEVIAQNTLKWTHRLLNQKNVVLLLGKFQNNKFTETEIWHPEHLEECSYYRDYENF